MDHPGARGMEGLLATKYNYDTFSLATFSTVV